MKDQETLRQKKEQWYIDGFDEKFDEEFIDVDNNWYHRLYNYSSFQSMEQAIDVYVNR